MKVTSPSDVYCLEGTACITLASKTYYAISQKTSKSIRLKVTPKYNINKTVTIGQYMCELKIWRQISVEMQKCGWRFNGIERIIEDFEDNDNYYIAVNGFSNQTIKDYVNDFDVLPEGKVKSLMQQMVEIISFLHSRGIALRNLRPESLLVNASGRLHLCDFAFATYFKDERNFLFRSSSLTNNDNNNSNNNNNNGSSGTNSNEENKTSLIDYINNMDSDCKDESDNDKNDNSRCYLSGIGEFCDDFYDNSVYCSPEMIRGDKYRATSVDVWSLGVILYEIATKTLPWDCSTGIFGSFSNNANPNMNMDQDMRKNHALSVERAMLVNHIFTEKVKRTPFLSITEYDLITKMLEPDVTRRYSIQQVEKHFWLTKNDIYNEIRNSKQMMKPNSTTIQMKASLSLTSRERLACIVVPPTVEKCSTSFYITGKNLVNARKENVLQSMSANMSDTSKTGRAPAGAKKPLIKNFLPYPKISTRVKLSDLLNINVNESDFV